MFGTPLNVIEKFPCRLPQADEVIATVRCRTEYRVASVTERVNCGSQMLRVQIGTVSANGNHRGAAIRCSCKGMEKPMAQVVALLAMQGYRKLSGTVAQKRMRVIRRAVQLDFDRSHRPEHVQCVLDQRTMQMRCRRLTQCRDQAGLHRAGNRRLREDHDDGLRHRRQMHCPAMNRGASRAIAAGISGPSSACARAARFRRHIDWLPTSSDTDGSF